MDIQFALSILLFVLPAYVANALPVLLGGGTPMDLGKSLGGKRILGDGKTIRGFFAGVLGGTVAGGILTLLIRVPFFPSAQFQFLAFALMSFGTMAGDALGSFLKRRLGMQDGKPFILDQLMFLAVALLLAYPLSSPEPYAPIPLVALFAATYVLHLGSNFVANRLGWKKVPW